MANTLPVNDNRAVTDFIMARARAGAATRVYPIGAVTKSLDGRDLAEMAELAEAGCVAFSDDGQCVTNAQLYRRAMEYALPFGVPIISHAEDPHLAAHGVMHEGLVSTELGLPGQPAATEDVMVARDILLAELTSAHLHIAHISTAGAVRLVREARARGVRVTAEVTPHHLLLTDEAVRSWDPTPEDGAAAPDQARRRGAAGGARRRHHRLHRHRSRAPRAVGEGGRVLDGGQRRRRARDRRAPAARPPRPPRAPRPRHAGRPASPRVPPASCGCREGAWRRARPPTSPCSTSPGRGRVEPASFASKSRNTPFAGAHGVGAAVMTIVGGARVAGGPPGTAP